MITQQQLGEFDSLEIFDESYIKVRRGDRYNLIDKNGNWLTDWCESIEKSNGGGINLKHNEGGVSYTRQYTSAESVRRADFVSRLITDISVLSDIDIDDVEVLDEPISLVVYDNAVPNRTSRTLPIVAKVKYMGENLYLSNEGSLYYEDGRKYELPQFAVSYTDINRLQHKVNHLNFVLNTEFANTEKQTSKLSENIERKQSAWVFGFNGGEKYYTCGAKHSAILNVGSNPWGGNKVKLRIIEKSVKTVTTEQLSRKMNALNFSSANTELNGETLVWWTKQYEPTELEQIFSDIEKLSTLSFYTEEDVQ